MVSLQLLDKMTPSSVVMAPTTPPVGGWSRLGHEIDVLLTAALSSRNGAMLDNSYFTAGEYCDTTPGVLSNSDVDLPQRGVIHNEQ